MTVSIVAEGGCEHGGDLGEARRIIDLALEAGADVVKTQLFSTDHLVSKVADPRQYDKLAALELSAYQADMLVRHAPGKVAFSVFDAPSLRIVAELDVPFIKLGSGELSDLNLIRAAAKTGKPLVLSTGMHSEEDVERASSIIGSTPTADQNTIFLHCTSAYPASGPLDMGRVCRYGFDRRGYSDHTTTPMAATMAVALGASMIEAHVTTGKGPDAAMAWDLRKPGRVASLSGGTSFSTGEIPPGSRVFIDYVQAIRKAEVAMRPALRVHDQEAPAKLSSRKSLVATCHIGAGELFTPYNLGCMRPGTGVPASQYDDYIGKPAERDYLPGELL